MVGGFLVAPQSADLANNPQFIALQGQMNQMAEALSILVGRGAAPVTPPVADSGVVTEGSGGSSSVPQGPDQGAVSGDLDEEVEGSSGDESGKGEVGHDSDLRSGPD